MRNPVHALLSAIERDRGGIAIVRCPDLGLRDHLVAEVTSLLPTATRAFRTDSVEEALGAPDRLALLVPANEREVVLDLDGGRDRARDRRQPIVLFLLRDGEGSRALAEEAPSLRSWTAGSDPDPEALAEIDVSAERRAFEDETGSTPEAWLVHWRSGRVPRDSAGFARAFHAMLLEER